MKKNRFEEDFGAFVKDLLERLTMYLSTLYDEESYSEEWGDEIVERLADIYAYMCVDESLAIFQQTNVSYDENMIEAVTSHISREGFIGSEKERLSGIILANFKKLLEGVLVQKRASEKSGETKETAKEEFMVASLYILVRFVKSEVHMAQEKASLDIGLVVEKVASSYLKEATGDDRARVILYKTWHCHHDGKTCEVCLSMDGSRVRVDEAFSKDLSGMFSGLDYVGGMITYAHPNCRCWVTYDAEEVIIQS